MAFAQEAKLEGIRRTWSKMTVDFDGSREDCPLLADLSEAHGAYGEDDQRINGRFPMRWNEVRFLENPRVTRVPFVEREPSHWRQS